MLKQQIESEIKEAMKAGNREILETLRFLMASIKNYEIETQREATDEDVITMVQRQVKQHKESVEAFVKAGRTELAEKEKRELEILQKFLPAQMSEEEVKAVTVETISSLAEADRKNFGKVMGAVMARVKGRAEGNMVGRVVKELLNKQITQ